VSQLAGIVTDPVEAPFTVTSQVKSVSHTWTVLVPVLVTFPTRALLVFEELTGPLTITFSEPSLTTEMIVTVTVPVPGELTFPLVSVAVYWNVTVPPLVVGPLSVNVATHGVGELLTLTVSRGSDGAPAEHDATATLSVAGNVTVAVPPAFMLVLRSPATGGVVSGAAATCSASVAVAVSAGESESVTVATTLKSPDAVGVPEITPAELMFNPAGKPVADQEYGGVPAVAVSVAEYGLPCVASGSGDVVVIATCGTGTIVTVTVPGDVLTFPLVSVALYWNVTVAPPADAPAVSVSVA
jgi:hypothetical protein